MTDSLPQQQQGSAERSVALQASHEVSERLVTTARKLRFTALSRLALFRTVGLRPRLIDRLFSASFVLATGLLLVLPVAAATAYYGLLASDQYLSETRFVLRSSTPALGKDQFANVTGIPSAKIVQDTQIVLNFIESHEMLDSLAEQGVDLRRVYGDPSIDWWARLPADASAEDMLEYWTDMTDVSVSASSGIVTLEVNAFRPEDAALLVREVLRAAENVVNRVNDRIWSDVVATARGGVAEARDRVQEARTTLALSRKQDGILTVESQSQVLNELIARIEAEKLELQRRYEANLSVVSPDAPQMQVLDREIKSKQQQIADLQDQVAGQSADKRTLADVSREMSQLQLAEKLAEEQFAAALNTLEQVQFVSNQQLLYLESFLEPRVPDEALYPRRILWILSVVLTSLLVWSITLALLKHARDRLLT